MSLPLLWGMVCHGQQAARAQPLALADQPNTVRNKFAPLCAGGAIVECASHAGALLVCSMAADRYHAQHGCAWQKRERGSRTPKGKAPILGLSQENFPDSIGTSRQWHPAPCVPTTLLITDNRPLPR